MPPGLRRTAILALVAAALAAGGCQVGPRPLHDPAALPSGEWAVVAIRVGSAPVRAPNDVIARYGQVIRYEPQRVASGKDSCDNPVYLAHALVADRYLYAEYGFRAADLGLHRWQDVRVTEVFCKGRKWQGLGGEAFWVDDTTGYAVHDDVLYELRRKPPPG